MGERPLHPRPDPRIEGVSQGTRRRTTGPGPRGRWCETTARPLLAEIPAALKRRKGPTPLCPVRFHHHCRNEKGHPEGWPLLMLNDSTGT